MYCVAFRDVVCCVASRDVVCCVASRDVVSCVAFRDVVCCVAFRDVVCCVVSSDVVCCVEYSGVVCCVGSNDVVLDAVMLLDAEWLTAGWMEQLVLKLEASITCSPCCWLSAMERTKVMIGLNSKSGTRQR